MYSKPKGCEPCSWPDCGCQNSQNQSSNDQRLIQQLREMATDFAADNKTDLKQHVCWIAADRIAATMLRSNPGAGAEPATAKATHGSQRVGRTAGSNPATGASQMARPIGFAYSAEIESSSRPSFTVYRKGGGYCDTPVYVATLSHMDDIREASSAT